MRRIDEKHHIEAEEIIKSSNGQPIPGDEPLFLLRGRDHLAVPLLKYYEQLCLIDGCNDYQMAIVKGEIDRFERFAVESPQRMKQPGITSGH